MAVLYYRMVAYLFAAGKYTDALSFLELALSADPEKYHILFEYLPQLQGNHVIVDIIKKYTEDDETTRFNRLSARPFFF